MMLTSVEALQRLPKDKPVFVYCRSGNRSGQAMDQMKKMGFREVYNLQGGIGAWSAAGLPYIVRP
ncbi:MAG: rhodanese-like domain-containing protein [Saprospiraceae bacterium]